MKKRLIKLLILTLFISTSVSIKAYGIVDGYLIKDNADSIYQFNLKELKNSLISNTLGNKDLLFEEFKTRLNSGKMHLLYDSEGKYVSYDEVRTILINKTLNNEKFDLDNEMKNSKASEVPAIIETIKKENNILTRDLAILKDGTTVEGSKISKDKYKSIFVRANNVTLSNLDILGEIFVDPGNLGKVKIDSVKCGKVNILSGDKKGIIFNKVESKEVKIDEKLGIEIQYEDKQPGGSTAGGAIGSQPGNSGNTGIDEAEKQAMLEKAKSELEYLYLQVNTENEKKVVNKIKVSIISAIENPSYNYENDMNEAKAIYSTLTEEEESDIEQKVLDYLNLGNIYKLADAYGIDITAMLAELYK